jgi:DNA-binding NarL/FixJ family response regulator
MLPPPRHHHPTDAEVLAGPRRWWHMVVAEPPAQPGRRLAVCNVAIEAADEAGRERLGAVAAACGYAVAALPQGDDELGRRRAGAAPDVIVMAAPVASEAPQAIRELCGRVPGTPIVVVLTGTGSPSELRKALKAGADGVVLDEELGRALVPTIDAVRHGQVAVPRALRGNVIRQPLSHREKQVLRLVVAGCTNRQIADTLYLAESTVKTHLSSAFGKLNARSRAEAAALILDPDEGLGPGILSLAPSPGSDG